MNNGSRSFSWPWFILGCFLLLVAVVAFFWGFALGELTPARRFLLMWILPLASAFACGCFSGAMSASGPLALSLSRPLVDLPSGCSPIFSCLTPNLPRRQILFRSLSRSEEHTSELQSLAY